MGYIISDTGKDLLGDVKEFCRNEIFGKTGEFDESGEWPEEIYGMLTEMQLNMLDIPEEYGGLGLSNVDHAALLEEIARADAGIAVTLNGTSLALHAVFAAGNEKQIKKCCEIVGKGGLGAFALTEPSAGCDASNVRTTAVKKNGEYILNGNKCFITNAPKADFFVVIAATDRTCGTNGLSAFLLEKGTAGLSTGSHENKMGIRTSITSDVILDDVHVPEENLLGMEGTGFITAMKALDAARIWCGVTAVGVSQRCIDEAAAYAKTRIQFGRPISSNEVIQFKLADMQIKTEAARQLCVYALTLMERGNKFSEASAAAKCMAGDAAVFSASEAVQIFGGYGYSREFPADRLYRDAKIFQIFEGTNEIQRLVIGRSVVGKAERMK